MIKIKAIGVIAVIFMGILFVSRANSAPVVPPANPAILLDVIYTEGALVSGPLSFGLATLPTKVKASFLLSPTPVGPIPIPLPNTGQVFWGLADILSASITFGDASWNSLASFSMETDDGEAVSLNYAFLPGASLTAPGSIVLNFPLNITGTDTASGTAFEYGYAASSQSLTYVAEPATLSLLGLGLAGLGLAVRRRKTAGLNVASQ